MILKDLRIELRELRQAAGHLKQVHKVSPDEALRYVVLGLCQLLQAALAQLKLLVQPALLLPAVHRGGSILVYR
jgi:hypothetical protein